MKKLRINEPLTRQAFYILLALVDRPQHGYGIIELVAKNSQSRLIMPTGTVYTVLKRLEKEGLVEKVPTYLIAHRGTIPYEITQAGREALEAEMVWMDRAVIDARRKLAVDGVRNRV
jgi:DNA-binding PadR family transcriptional regulator